ncbi:hypothetical protein O6H91_08G115200 [Diphasiastrum complanatum]|uniref:Uncharacterized protein n=1 Tax=Diphasiastrum complanatum TaxID=34168 RepID=A0ACC2D1E9_DIPCM|nr:hypothetical protein O6H91_08G115200 [Diphasiastrum complanatum]
METSKEESAEDSCIVWPPVVIIENTRLAKDPKTRKFTGLDNEEVRTFLKGVSSVEYSRVMAVYDFRGHKGKTLVTFPGNDLGYINAQTLNDCLQRIGRGREQWIKVMPVDSSNFEGWDTEDLLTEDGKRILYGYLARPKDMEHVDPHKKHVKKWSVENLEEKVHRPARQRNQDAEKAEARRKELEQVVEEAANHLQNEKTGVDMLKEALNKINKEIEEGREREEAAEARHRQELSLRRKAFEEDLQKRKLQYQEMELEIRTQVSYKKASLLRNTMKWDQEAQELQHAIEEKKRKHEMRQKEALEEMTHDCDLQALMEARLADLKSRMHEMTLKLQRKHQDEKMKLKKRIQNEREEFLQEHLTVRTELENNAKAAKEETNRLKTETDSTKNKECVVCYFEFGADKLRAYFEACGHANVCIHCADEMWQFKNKACPTCKAAQKKKPTKFPVNIYL